MSLLALVFLLSSLSSIEGVDQNRKVPDQALAPTVPKSTQHRIHSTDSHLHYDSDVICPILMNPKDGMQDLPDSVWDGLVLAPIVSRVATGIEKGKGEKTSFLYSSPANFPYAYAKPILRSIADGGVHDVFVPLGERKFFRVELMLAKNSHGVVHSGDKTGFNTILTVHPDSILIYVNTTTSNGVVTHRVPSNDRSKFSEAELRGVDSVLVNKLSKNGFLSWVGIDPHPSIPFSKLTQLLAVVDRINTAKAVPRGINVFLYGVYNPWEI